MIIMSMITKDTTSEREAVYTKGIFKLINQKHSVNVMTKKGNNQKKYKSLKNTI